MRGAARLYTRACENYLCLTDCKFGKPHREPVCRAAEEEAGRIAEIVAAKAAADSAEAVERCSASPARNSAFAARNSASAALFSASTARFSASTARSGDRF